MPYIHMTQEEMRLARRLLIPAAWELSEKIHAALNELGDAGLQERNSAYRNAVRASDDLDVDGDAIVSVGDDPGAWVHTWTWVTNSEADLCDNCGGLLDDGEGYDGLCGYCADEAEEEGE